MWVTQTGSRFLHQAVVLGSLKLNVDLVCLIFGGKDLLWFSPDLHAFYWLVWDLGRKPELMPLLPLQTDARHP